MNPSRMHVFSLFVSLRVATDGSTGAANTYTNLDVQLPRGAAEAILRAESIELITLQKNGPQNGELRWNMDLISGMDRDNENAAVTQLASADIQANDATVRQAAITALGSFLPHSRLRLRLRNDNGVTGVRTAVITAMLLVKVASH